MKLFICVLGAVVAVAIGVATGVPKLLGVPGLFGMLVGMAFGCVYLSWSNRP